MFPPHRNHGGENDVVTGREFVWPVYGPLEHGAIHGALAALVAAPQDGHPVAALEAVTIPMPGRYWGLSGF